MDAPYKIILQCKRVKFYDPCDEDAFFEWIKKITCISHVAGERDAINLYLADKKINKQQINSLVGLFRRYKINMKQLEVFVTKKNQDFFAWSKKHFSINVYPAKKS